MGFIQYIKSAKAKKKWTNEALSEASGVSVGTLNKVLSGDSADPKLSTAAAICRALSVSLDEACELVSPAAHGEEEAHLLMLFRACDSRGKSAVLNMLEKEREFSADTAPASRVLPAINFAERAEEKKRTLRLYDLPVSAGYGMFLENASYSEISVPAAAVADFALRIRGNSMEPLYHDGDMILVKQGSEVGIGELGIFSLDGDGYFKKFGGDRLISLNPDYSDILLKNYNDITCIGSVVGKLRRKKN